MTAIEAAKRAVERSALIINELSPADAVEAEMLRRALRQLAEIQVDLLAAALDMRSPGLPAGIWR